MESQTIERDFKRQVLKEAIEHQGLVKRYGLQIAEEIV